MGGFCVIFKKRALAHARLVSLAAAFSLFTIPGEYTSARASDSLQVSLCKKNLPMNILAVFYF